MAEFEHVYIVTSTNKEGRYNELLKELGRVGARDVTVIWGFAGNGSPIDQLVLKHVPHGGDTGTTPCVWGGWNAHYRAIRTAWERGQDNVLFVEDDCRFRSSLDDLYGGLGRAPGDWAILMLDSIVPVPYDFDVDRSKAGWLHAMYSDSGWVRVRSSWSSACYMANRVGLEKLLAAYEAPFDPSSGKSVVNSDHYFTPAWLPDAPIYAAVPNLAIQQNVGDPSASTWGVKAPAYEWAGLDTSMFAPFKHPDSDHVDKAAAVPPLTLGRRLLSKEQQCSESEADLLTGKNTKGAGMRTGTINRLAVSDFTAAVKVIFDAEGTDKARSDGLDASRIGKVVAWHHYQETYASQFIRLYARHLRGEPVRVAEIGVQYGASMRAMRRILPFAELYGFDVTPCGSEISGVTMITGDGYSEAAWRSVPADLDFIIDDGSHRVEDMLRGIPVFVSHLRPGGVLMIEDIPQSAHAESVMAALPGSELVDTRDKGGVDDLTVLYQRPL